MKRGLLILGALLSLELGATAQPATSTSGVDLYQNNALAVSPATSCRLKNNAGAIQWSCGGGAYSLFSLQSAYNAGNTIVLSGSGVQIQDAGGGGIGVPLLSVASNGGGTSYFSVSAFAAGQALITLADGSGAALSGANLMNLVYDNIGRHARLSINGGAYDDVLTSTAAQNVSNKTFVSNLLINGTFGLGYGGFSNPTLNAIDGYGGINTRVIPNITGLAVSCVGGGSGTNWAYTVVGVDAFGNVTQGPTSVTVSCSATLDGTHYPEVTWNASANPALSGYYVIRTTAAGTPNTTGRITALLSAGTTLFDDKATAVVAAGILYTQNDTANIISGGAVVAKGLTGSSSGANATGAPTNTAFYASLPSQPNYGFLASDGTTAGGLTYNGATGMFLTNRSSTPMGFRTGNLNSSIYIDASGRVVFKGSTPGDIATNLASPSALAAENFAVASNGIGFMVSGNYGSETTFPATVSTWLTGNLRLAMLGTTNSLALTVGGATGATTVCYYLVPLDPQGNKGIPSQTVCKTNANATLDASHTITITITFDRDVASYDVIRSTAPTTPNTTGKIGNVVCAGTTSSSTLIDNGLTASAYSLPTTNTTADARFDGPLSIGTGAAPTVGLDAAGGIRVRQLGTPGAPTVTPTGGAAGNYTYYCVNNDRFNNTSLAGATTAIANGPTTLDATHINTVTCPASNGAVSQAIVRSVGGPSQGVIFASYPPNTPLVDNGLTASAAPTYARNLTGDLVVDGNATLSGALANHYNSQSGTTYTIATNDFYVGMSNSGARTVTLCAANAVPAGFRLIIKDENGNALTNNVTINRAGADTIDGATTATIATNYGVLSLISDGNSKWFTTAKGL